MLTSGLRTHLCQYLRQITNRNAKELDTLNLASSSVVFSPHQDDETLGCGGTIIRKTRLGAQVWIVFMTDGSGSHQGIIPENELKAIRRKEALEASRVLGVEESHLIFLDFKDGCLGQYRDNAINCIIELLHLIRPCEIFVPYYEDIQRDHISTHQIVMSAIWGYDREVILNEYPVWFWSHWPWVSTPIPHHRRTLADMLKDTTAGMRLIKDFRYQVKIGEVLELKRTALEQYKSQMIRFVPGTPWQTLWDVSDGEFLDCFFQDSEIFRRYIFPEGGFNQYSGAAASE